MKGQKLFWFVWVPTIGAVTWLCSFFLPGRTVNKYERACGRVCVCAEVRFEGEILAYIDVRQRAELAWGEVWPTAIDLARVLQPGEYLANPKQRTLSLSGPIVCVPGLRRGTPAAIARVNAIRKAATGR